MSNELKDIADKLNGYGLDGWKIISADKRQDGGWALVIFPMTEEENKNKQEAKK